MNNQPMELIFATNNLHKLQEVRAIAGTSFQIRSLAEAGFSGDIPETADTLEGNALLKARFIAERAHSNCFADDTGLEINALNGRPGVYSARYAGEGHDFEANIDKVLSELIGAEDRSARFRTVISLILNGDEFLFEGIVNGQILTERRGTEGFGYDSVFVPEGESLSFAEMRPDQKNTISHRARATEKLAVFLKQRSGTPEK
jgi:XTP/dITP diphosphohydrolase